MSTTAKEQTKQYCRTMGTFCEYATYWGACRVTACKYHFGENKGIDYTHTNGGTFVGDKHVCGKGK